jgi:hypothetical protein
MKELLEVREPLEFRDPSRQTTRSLTGKYVTLPARASNTYLFGQ